MLKVKRKDATETEVRDGKKIYHITLVLAEGRSIELQIFNSLIGKDDRCYKW